MPRRKGYAKESILMYRKRTCHTRETFWKLNGKPPHISKSHVMIQQLMEELPQSKNLSTIVNEKSKIEQLEKEVRQLRALFTGSTSVVGSTSFTNSGKDLILSRILYVTPTQMPRQPGS